MWIVYNFKLISANKYMLKVSNSNSKVWNLFEVNNKGTKTTSTRSLWFMANRLLSKYFFLQPFSPKIQFLHCLLDLLPPWGAPVLATKGGIFEIHVSRLLENAFPTISLGSITCTSLKIWFFPWILWFGDRFTRNCITLAGPYGAGYHKNGNYFFIVNNRG